MQLSEEVRMLGDTVDDFGRKELMSAYRDLEPKGEFPRELVSKISQMGLMGISFPEEYGGMGMNTVATSVVGERLAFYWPSLQLIWSANVSLAGYPVVKFGDEGQKQRILPYLATGEMLGCYALTEPGAGSDAANIQAKAEIRGQPDIWVLNGTKTFITNALDASLCVLFARVKAHAGQGLGKRHEGISAFLLMSDGPGLKRNKNPFYPPEKIMVKKIDKWGLCCSKFCEIVLEDVAVAEGNVLGEIGKGFGIAMETLNNGRINIAAQSVGIARRALFEAEKYGSERVAFGAQIIKMKTQASRLKRLTQKVERAWELTLAASCAKDSGQDYRVAAARAKLFASETAVQCAMFNYRLHGGFGYTTESIAMPILHDALATITYEGTSDIQKLVITKG
jgi:alkylation response protein AidB-like acyl-CoA dehydrogenase